MKTGEVERFRSVLECASVQAVPIFRAVSIHVVVWERLGDDQHFFSAGSFFAIAHAAFLGAEPPEEIFWAISREPTATREILIQLFLVRVQVPQPR